MDYKTGISLLQVKTKVFAPNIKIDEQMAMVFLSEALQKLQNRFMFYTKRIQISLTAGTTLYTLQADPLPAQDMVLEVLAVLGCAVLDSNGDIAGICTKDEYYKVKAQTCVAYGYCTYDDNITGTKKILLGFTPDGTETLEVRIAPAFEIFTGLGGVVNATYSDFDLSEATKYGGRFKIPKHLESLLIETALAIIVPERLEYAEGLLEGQIKVDPTDEPDTEIPFDITYDQ